MNKNLTPEQKRELRAQNKENEKNKKVAAERTLEKKAYLRKIYAPLQSTEEYINLFKKAELSKDEWETILVDFSTKIYSVRKPFGIMGKKQCLEYKEGIAKTHGYTVFLIEAIFKFFKFEDFKEVLGDILIEALKYPLDGAKKSAEEYLKELIEKEEISPLFWRKLLLKRYVSGATWKLLIQYYSVAEQKNCVQTIRQAIEDHMKNPDLTKKERDQMAENWEELEKTPLEVYKVEV
ncbi:MAG: hypothetical protein PHE89_07940 [Alphaproteobacteria bacterium]|nr:hypothetical protein [Alphaproteobacteria bacterium]